MTDLTAEKILEARDWIPSIYHTIYCHPAFEEIMIGVVGKITQGKEIFPSIFGMRVITKKSMPRNIIMMAGEGESNYQFMRIGDPAMDLKLKEKKFRVIEIIDPVEEENE